MAGNIHKGDYVKLDCGQEGFVEDVPWRITTLRTIQNNPIVIPNSKLSEALVTNYSFPEKRLAVPIPLGVGYEADIDHVERVVLEEVEAARGLDGLVFDPPPVVRFNPGFGDFSLNLTLIVHVAELTQQYHVQDQLRRRILARFRREGISIPFPIRTLDLPPGSLRRAALPGPPRLTPLPAAPYTEISPLWRGFNSFCARRSRPRRRASDLRIIHAEKNVSAEQSPARQNARLPCSHEDEERAGGARAAPGAGPLEALRQ